MQDWRKRKGLIQGRRFTCVFEGIEREVLGHLAATVSDVLIERAQSAPKDELAELTGMPSGHKDAPSDPGLARLLPDFEKEGDEEYEGEQSLLRSLHETDITREKLTNLHTLIDGLQRGGDEVSITPEEVDAWLKALNDIRLYLASGGVPDTGVAEDRDQLVDWLGYIQESLLQAAMG